MEEEEDFVICHICGDASDSCDCDDSDEDDDMDSSWFTDPSEGARE